jgi:hypothetical protein
MNAARRPAKARLLAALAQARIARLYSAEVLDNDPEVVRVRAEGHFVVALPHVRVVIYRHSKRHGAWKPAGELWRHSQEGPSRP